MSKCINCPLDPWTHEWVDLTICKECSKKQINDILKKYSKS